MGAWKTLSTYQCLLNHAQCSVLPHSMGRTYEDSGCSPPGQRYRRTEDLHLLCPVSRGRESEPYRTNRGLGRSGTLTPGPGHWLTMHIHKVKDELLILIFIHEILDYISS